MKVRQILAVFSVAASAACSDYQSPVAPLPGPVPEPVLLKDLELSSLPSPLYHFEYEGTGRVSKASYASGLTTYDFIYDGDQLLRVRPQAAQPGRELRYIYDDQGRVSTIVYINSTGAYTVLFLTFDGDRLVEVERDRRLGGGFIIDKVSTFTYDAAGNVTQLKIHRPAIVDVQSESTGIQTFGDYDTGINVEGFSLLHDEFFDELVMLPGVRLQIHNPRTETRTGDGVNYVIDWTYTYDAKNRPTAKSGKLTLTNGGDTGTIFQLTGSFTYY